LAGNGSDVGDITAVELLSGCGRRMA
jgi:hypothetical protein